MFSRIADQYKDRNAVVIGAGGIGGAIAGLLYDSVANLVVADYDESLLSKIASACGSQKLTTQRLDVRDASAVTELFKATQAKIGAPHFCFYAAGILNIESFAQTSVELWTRAVDVNLNGAFYCTKAAAELMVAERRGSILLLGSIAGTKARSGSRVSPVYNSTKAAL